MSPTSERQSILVVDDEISNRTRLTELFKDSYRVILAKDGPMALQLAYKYLPDLVLLDVLMPGMSGYEVIQQLKCLEQTRDIPVIFITALEGDADEERGLLFGAVDYIAKPFYPPIVRARVNNHMSNVRQRRLLERYALFDALTELPNRRRLEYFLNSRVVAHSKFSLAMIDVDRFKLLNDTYGHAQGDKALQLIATALRGVLRHDHDLIARYGGEEFVLCLSHTGRDEAISIAERMRAAVGQLVIEHLTGSLCVSISIGGVSTTIGADGVIPAQLLARADEQVYCAKQAGRNQVCWADAVPD